MLKTLLLKVENIILEGSHNSGGYAGEEKEKDVEEEKMRKRRRRINRKHVNG